MARMKKDLQWQLLLGVSIILVGSGLVAGEYFLVKWYPRHTERVHEETLTLLPYRNDALGIQMRVAAGLYATVEGFPGGVRIMRSKFWSIGPSLTITSQPNPDQAPEFSPQLLAKWETQGVTEELPRYHFEHTKIQNRDAVLIRQYKQRSMLLTAHVISPERIVEANCSPGAADEDLFMEACEESLRTIKVAGPEAPPPNQGVVELTASPRQPARPARATRK
jgi:hypothetical protein